MTAAVPVYAQPSGKVEATEKQHPYLVILEMTVTAGDGDVSKIMYEAQANVLEVLKKYENITVSGVCVRAAG